MTLFSQVASRDHVNHLAQQGKEKEKKMTVTSGLKCLEQFEKLNRSGLWAKTFAGLLVGMEGWYSTKCRLIWKMKDTKSSRFYFQLAPSMLPIEESGFGLLPTPKAMEIEEDYAKWRKRMVASGNPKNMGKTNPNLGTLARNLMLPTPTASNYKGGATRTDPK
jgi:hypothetical protein